MDTNYDILCTSYTLYKDFTTTPHGIYIYSTSISSSEVYFENNLHESHAEHTCPRSVVPRLVARDICRRKQAFNSFSAAYKFYLSLDLIQINILQTCKVHLFSNLAWMASKTHFIPNSISPNWFLLTASSLTSLLNRECTQCDPAYRKLAVRRRKWLCLTCTPACDDCHGLNCYNSEPVDLHIN